MDGERVNGGGGQAGGTPTERESVLVDVYRVDDGRLLSYDALCEEVLAEIEAQGIPDESWRGGEFDFHDYLIESCLVGIYEQVPLLSTVTTQYTNGRDVWTYEQMRDEVFPAETKGVDMDQFIGGELSFEDWLAESCNVGIYNRVDKTVYTDENDEIVTVIESDLDNDQGN